MAPGHGTLTPAVKVPLRRGVPSSTRIESSTLVHHVEDSVPIHIPYLESFPAIMK
jgi:hypothetical protein